MKSAIYLLLAATIIGNLLRIPFAGGGINLADLGVVLVLIAWIPTLLQRRKRRIEKFVLPLFAFFGVALISLLYNSFVLGLDLKEFLISISYLLRLGAYSLLFFVGYDIAEKFQIKYIYWTGVAIAVTGFIQLLVFPDFSELAMTTLWDPHIGRLLGSWLDPNFIGGLFAFLITILSGIESMKPRLFELNANKIILGILILALLLTFSRSAYLACLVGATVIGIIQRRKILAMIVVVIVVALSSSTRIQDRVRGAFEIDATSSLRIESWVDHYQLWTQYPILGTGYNTLSYVKKEAGLIETRKIHSATGSDSSLLNILLMTGVFGFGFYLWFGVAVLRSSWRSFANHKLDLEKRGLALGLFAGIIAVTVHSQFVNSLLFPFMMVFSYLLAGIVIRKTQI